MSVCDLLKYKENLQKSQGKTRKNGGKIKWPQLDCVTSRLYGANHLEVTTPMQMKPLPQKKSPALFLNRIHSK